jgi:sialate O-acetylesterase
MKNILTSIILLLAMSSAQAQLKLSKVFADSMIIQRNQPIKIWGKAIPNQVVTVTFNEQKYTSKTSTDSSFICTLPEQKEGGPFQISVSSTDKTITLKDIYLGDIWVCGGQSNMEFRLNATANAKTEIPTANFPLIRQLYIPRFTSDLPIKEINKANWTVCTPKNAGNFSAVAYFFAKEIYQKTNIPIGLVNSTIGGSSILAWTGKAHLENLPDAKIRADAIYEGFITTEKKRRQDIFLGYEANFFKNIPYLSSEKNLLKSDFFNNEGWQPIKVPGTIQSQNLPVKQGYIWMKNEVEIPDNFLDEEVSIDMDRTRDSEVTFINGTKIGNSVANGYQHSYKIPKGLLHAGKNEILMACYSETKEVGFSGIYLPKLTIKKKDLSLVLEKGWQYKQGLESNTKDMLGKIEIIDWDRNYPTLPYNSMIAPLANMGIKGFLWYQGEQNANGKECWDYDKMQENLITSWRELFQQKDAPFYIVQLPNYGKITKEPKPTAWAVLREQQAKVANTVANVGFIATIDLGNPDDIHPTNKIEVGKRLALLARKNVYGEPNLVALSPTFKSMEIKDNQAILSFDNIGGGLVANDNTESLNAFALAGNDNVYYRAEAKIVNNKVIVFSEKVPQPIAVRYAFEASPTQINFYNKEGLPVAPFRTDKEKIEKLF